jgi:Ca-activated chloride channel family protein
MSFAAPGFLIGLLALPAALAALQLARRRTRRYAVRFPGVTTAAALLPRASAIRRHLPLAMYLLALAAAILALARPEATVAVPIERASVILVTDASRSMLATDVKPSRLGVAQAAGKRFLDRLPRRFRAGAVGYSDVPHTLTAPTTDRAEIKSSIDSLTADGGTATGEAIQAALRLLDLEKKKRPPAAIVLLSDGKATQGRDPVEAARIAGRAHVPIYTVALGTKDGILPGYGYGAGLPVPPDPETLRRIADASGGHAFQADDAGELDTAYKRLRSEIGSKDGKREVTAGFAGGGMIFMLAAAFLSLRWAGRLP